MITRGANSIAIAEVTAAANSIVEFVLADGDPAGSGTVLARRRCSWSSDESARLTSND
jgi:hypothetical protein